MTDEARLREQSRPGMRCYVLCDLARRVDSSSSERRTEDESTPSDSLPRWPCSTRQPPTPANQLINRKFIRGNFLLLPEVLTDLPEYQS